MNLHLHFERLSSTSNYLKELVKKYPMEKLQDFFPPYFAITADIQEEGRGQQNKKWESEAGENLLVSFLLYPKIKPAKQFTVCQYVSVGISEFIRELFNIPNVSIKWPNDIYIGDKKVAGILIEHFICGDSINYTIVGIGMNINQIDFSKSLPNPTSIYLETEKKYDPIFCMKSLIKKMKQTEKLPLTNLKTLYANYLYKRNIYSDFILPKTSNTPISLKIKGVGEFGLLELQDKNNTLHCYAFNEIIYLKKEK